MMYIYTNRKPLLLRAKNLTVIVRNFKMSIQLLSRQYVSCLKELTFAHAHTYIYYSITHVRESDGFFERDTTGNAKTFPIQDHQRHPIISQAHVLL